MLLWYRYSKLNNISEGVLNAVKQIAKDRGEDTPSDQTVLDDAKYLLDTADERLDGFDKVCHPDGIKEYYAVKRFYSKYGKEHKPLY